MDASEASRASGSDEPKSTPSESERSTLADMMRELWLQALPLVLSAGGLAALVVGVGGAVEAARFYGAGLPAYQAVDAAAQGELNVVGLTWLVTFGVLGILAVFVCYLASPKGKATPAMHYALIALAAAEAGGVWLLGRQEGFWDEWKANLIALAFVVLPAAGAVWVIARRHGATRDSERTSDGLFPAPLAHEVLKVDAKQREQPLVLRHIDFAALAGLSVLAGLGAGWALGHLWVGLIIPLAGVLGIVAIRIAELTGGRFRWYGVCVFFSVAFFGAALAVLRAVDEPRLQPVAFIVEEGNRAVAVEGAYVGESDGKLWFASVALGDCDELHVRPGSGRLWSVPRNRVTHLAVGPPVGLPKLAYEATAMLHELRAARPGREVTAYPSAVRDSVAVERLGRERGSPGDWVRAGSREDLGAHPQLRLGGDRLALRLVDGDWQIRVPGNSSGGPIYTACGERTNRAWLTVLRPPRALLTATSLGGGSWHLDGRASRDPDGSISGYRWTIPGQDPVEGEEVDIELPPGTSAPTARLRVTDDDGLSDERAVRLDRRGLLLASRGPGGDVPSTPPLLDIRRLAGASQGDDRTGPNGPVVASVLGAAGVGSR
jgi:hypothetical protein